MKSSILLGAAATAATATAASAALLVVLGRKVVMPRSPRLIDFEVDEGGTSVRLPLTSTTQAPGEHGLWFHDESAHARIGTVTGIDEAAGIVEREIVAVTGGDLRTATRGRWSGHAFARADHVHVDVEEVSIAAESGEAPAWVFNTDAGAPEGLWAVHVHGIRTSRFSALRSVPVALRLGMASIVPSYYGDSDNLGDGDRPCYLGQREWRDVEAALDYAVERGARRIVLFGWSMGGSISLLLSERSRHREIIAGIVLVSPATDMRTTIEGAARAARLPAPIARLVPVALGSWPMSALSGLEEPVDFAALDWTTPGGRVRVPTLAIHSEGDTDIPIASTRRFAAANTDYVSLVELDAVPHQLEWNASPERFEETVANWATETGLVLAPSTREPGAATKRQGAETA